MDLWVIYWVPLVVAAILGGSVVFRSGPERGVHATRGMKLTRLGALLVMVGVIATLSGLWMWVASVERQSEVLGAGVFLVGAAGTFVGLRLVDGRPQRSAED